MRSPLLFAALGLATVALLSPGVVSHPAGIPTGFTRLLHDCSDDWGPHGTGGFNELGHDLVALDVQERDQDGKKMIVFSITMGDASTGDTTDKLEQLTFETPRKKGANAIVTMVDTPQAESSSTPIEYVEGVRPAYMRAPLRAVEADGADDSSRLRAEIGYTYDQLQIQNGETITKFWVKSLYLSTVGGARNDADRMPGSDYTESDPTTCATPGPDAFTATAYKVAKSDWAVAGSGGGSTTPSTPGTNAPPAVDFSFTPASPSTQDLVTFADLSVDSDGTIATRSWNFGDGSPVSTEKNPTHRYLDNGVYKVKLTVTDNGGASANLEKEISVRNVAPVAAFDEPEHPHAHEPATFADNSSDVDGTITSWAWDFGDGKTSSDQNPTHTYESGGTYTVTLKVTDDDGATHTTTHEVTVESHEEGAPGAGMLVSAVLLVGLVAALRRRT